MGPRELTPDMGPDPILPEEKFTIGNIIRGINLTQIVRRARGLALLLVFNAAWMST